MGLKILCSGYLVRHPIGGHIWHHLQYLVGFQRMGHQVVYFEHYGWPDSCYDPIRDVSTPDPAYGIEYLINILKPHGLDRNWCYLAEDGTVYGMSREQLSQHCRDCDIYFNLSNINWIPELEACRKRVIVDTDPVLTQIGEFGMGGPYSRYDALFTYGENVHQPGSEMPTAGVTWIPSRQPVVLDLWPVEKGDPRAPFTTVTNWSPFGVKHYQGREFAQKDRQWEPFFNLPAEIGESMELAVQAPRAVTTRLLQGGWSVQDPLKISLLPSTYQAYLRSSRAEFSVAKHAYVSTNCGWFSDRSACYLASGRPVVLEDTGFTSWLPVGAGVLAFRSRAEAIAGIEEINGRYEFHCRAARDVVNEYFKAERVLSRMLDASMALTKSVPMEEKS